MMNNGFELDIKDWITKERNSFVQLCRLLEDAGYKDHSIMQELLDEKVSMNKFIKRLQKVIKE
jgi:hypothetical protein